jgi:hypothetical protein
MSIEKVAASANSTNMEEDSLRVRSIHSYLVTTSSLFNTSDDEANEIIRYLVKYRSAGRTAENSKFLDILAATAVFIVQSTSFQFSLSTQESLLDAAALVEGFSCIDSTVFQGFLKEFYYSQHHNS